MTSQLQSLRVESQTQSQNNEWHKSKTFCDAVDKFHDTYCLQPSGEQLTKAKARLTTILDQLRVEMGQLGVFSCKRFEYRGSTYEGVKVYKNPDDPDLEFDVMFVIDGGEKLEAIHIIPEKPGYSFLTISTTNAANHPFKQSAIHPSTIDFTNFEELEDVVNMPDTKVISAALTKSKFYGEVIKCPIIKNDKLIKIRGHGPAVQIDVYHQSGQKFFSIDLVPHYNLGKGGKDELYVGQFDKDIPDAWFRSYSLQSKRMFDAIDQGNGCRKKVLRILKVIRNRSTEISSLNSNILKTCLMLEVHERRDDLSWKQQQLGERLMDVLKRLQECLSNRFMPHFFIDGYNLFKKYDNELGIAIMNNMYFRIKHLRNSEIEMKKLISTSPSSVAVEGRQVQYETAAITIGEFKDPRSDNPSWMY